MTNDAQAENSMPHFTLGYSEELLAFYESMTNQDGINRMIAELRPGLRVLDIGCGPGFLSVRLAEAVAPGELHGIDLNPAQIALAQRVAAQRGVANAAFQAGDAVNLPFANGLFDVVHAGGLFLYLPDTAVAIAEVKRVLRPGGRLYARDLLIDSCFVSPELGMMERSWQLFADLVEADDGHPRIATEMRDHLRLAGFSEVEFSVTVETFYTQEQIARFAQLIELWFLQEELIEPAKAYGAATDQLIGEVGLCLEEWRHHPSAVAGIAFGNTVAIRP